MKQKSGLMQRDQRKSFYIFLSFWLVGFLIFQLIPILWGFRVSLTNRMAFSVTVKFTGLKNYIELFRDAAALTSIWSTLVYSFLNTAIQVGLGLFLALLLQKKIPLRSLFQVLYYLPYVIPIVATGWIFRIFLDRNIGFLNILLDAINLTSTKINWLGEHTMFSVLAGSFWRVGWSLLIFMGGLSTISQDLYDSASVDGANYFQRLRIITLPFLSPFIAFQLVVSFIYGMQIFILPYLLSPTPMRGANITMVPPPPETFFVLSKGYDTIFNKGRLAYGFALLWVTFIIVLILSMLFNYVAKRATYSEMGD